MSYQRMHSDLSGDKAPIASMRRIQSDISSAQPEVHSWGIGQAPPQQQAHQQQQTLPSQIQIQPSQQQQQPPAMDQKVATVAGGTAPVSSLLHRERSVHQILGGGKFADVVLWKQKRKSIGILGGSTLVWFVFEWSGYTLISLVANIVLFLLIALFAWANLAALVNRPLPPVPEVQLSDEKSNKIAKRVAKEVNGVLNYARSLSTGKDFPMLLKTCLMLWVLGNVGQWFSLLTLIYLGVLGTLTLPLAYERHEDQIDQFIQKIVQKARNQYHKLDECCLSKLPQCCKN